MSDFVSDGQMLNVDKVDTGTPSGPADTYALAAEWNSVNQAAMDLRTHVLALEAGGGGSVTVGTFGSTPNANGASASGSTLTLQPADGTHPGLLTSGAQTIGGAKTLTGALAGTSAVFSSALTGTSATLSSDLTARSLTLTGTIGGTGSVSLQLPSGLQLIWAAGSIIQESSGSIFVAPSAGTMVVTTGMSAGGTISTSGEFLSTTANSTALDLGSNNGVKQNTHLLFSGVAPTISAGSGAAVVATNGSVAGRLSLGAAAGTATVTLPAATTGWVIYAQDITTPGIKLKQTGSSTTTVTLTSYSETTGTATNWTASDNMVFIAFAY